MKHGLVLEGGALRGLYSMGIVDVLMDEGITFDGVVGVSAGAALGCNIKSGQVGRALRYNMRFAKDWRYCSLRSLITSMVRNMLIIRSPKRWTSLMSRLSMRILFRFGLSARMWRRVRLSIICWKMLTMKPMIGFAHLPPCPCVQGLLNWMDASYLMVAWRIVFRWHLWSVKDLIGISSSLRNPRAM